MRGIIGIQLCAYAFSMTVFISSLLTWTPLFFFISAQFFSFITHPHLISDSAQSSLPHPVCPLFHFGSSMFNQPPQSTTHIFVQYCSEILVFMTVDVLIDTGPLTLIDVL